MSQERKSKRAGADRRDFPKKVLRRRARQYHAGLSEAQQAEAAAIVAHHLLRWQPLQEAPLLLAYAALPGEISLHSTIEWAWEAQKEVALPSIQGEELHYYGFSTWRECRPNHWGILEPIPRAERRIASFPPGSIALLPGLMFDRQGYRLGRGGGFYDRFLQQPQPAQPGRGRANLFCVGITHEAMQVPSIHPEPHDVPMQALLTPAGWQRIGSASST